ncbi:hypothetical protein REPUB_Repub01dG0011700 [Reevesia pubescens]
MEQGKTPYRRLENNNFDWRTTLQSVFVKNLSRRVTKEALWEVFSLYGRVVDVHIPFSIRVDKDRNSLFAFVRYKRDFEAKKAIEEGNDRRINGRFIKVQKALPRSKKNNNTSKMDKENSVLGVLKTNEVTRDDRTYKEVLTGAKDQSAGELIIIPSPEERYDRNEVEQEKM